MVTASAASDWTYSCRMARHPERLVVIFDGDCILCRRSVHWLEHRATHVPIETIASGHAEVQARYGAIAGYRESMVAIADDGRSWVGPPDAYLVVMWAVRGTRMLSYLLALPGLKRLAGRVFQTVAGNRHLVGNLVRPSCAACSAVAPAR